MAIYMQKSDKRDTSKGVTPNKAIRREKLSSLKSKPQIKKTQTYRSQGK